MLDKLLKSLTTSELFVTFKAFPWTTLAVCTAGNYFKKKIQIFCELFFCSYNSCMYKCLHIYVDYNDGKKLFHIFLSFVFFILFFAYGRPKLCGTYKIFHRLEKFYLLFYCLFDHDNN